MCSAAFATPLLLALPHKRGSSRRCQYPVAPPSPPSPVMETPPPPVSKEEKRPRKRSRYLSPPYNSLLEVDDGDIISPASHEEESTNVATADLLGALLQCAADASSSSSSPVPAHVLLPFLGLYRASLLPKIDDTHQPALPAVAAAARGILNPNTCRAMAIADGSASTNICCIGPPANATAAAQAPSKKNKKKVSFAADDDSNNTATPDKKKRKRRRNSSSFGQQQHFRSPAALVLDFTQDTAVHLPSKEELLSTFRGFGFVVESHTSVSTDDRSARVVFATSAEAKAAYSCAHTLGAIPRLECLPPISLGSPSTSSPAPKPLPLTVMRKNLEKMIASLTCSPSFIKDGAHHLHLAGEMQRLLARVDNKLSAGPSATTAHHH